MAVLFAGSSFAQKNSHWENWSWLVGTWNGEGTGEPGKGGGTFTFTPGLKNQILERKSHSEYPALNNKPAVVHDDLMIVYPDYSGNPNQAIYFDSEGHTIHYTVTFYENKIVLVSEKMEHMPVFRLTYSLLSPGFINTQFEISQDSVTFSTYIEGKSKKVK